ncbi:hypothetical protein LTR36_008272 [Oleoguttula mirabilis]|uniref:Pre-rRNA-processing protein TSR2 homolog n=1 Tax=Oleoguttula mirabilis TaxID=1507867 RepID=A0AAV9J9W9_9PEZI|nr:hypothetical protein LTR36_008272 [Oleoguttula mirabilis]
MSAQSNAGPTPAGAPSASSSSGGGGNTNGGVALPPSPEKLQQALDHGIWYALSLWPALHVACQNAWGGEATMDKKDWFAGAVSELFTQQPETDNEELEIFLLQIMQDEFDCNVEDDSEVEVARTILRLKNSLVEDREVAPLRELEQRWRNRGQMKVNIQVIDNEAEGVDDDEEEFEGFDDDEDVDMDAAPDLVPVMQPRKEKAEPEVDEDGFTKVVGKKR